MNELLPSDKFTQASQSLDRAMKRERGKEQIYHSTTNSAQTFNVGRLEREIISRTNLLLEVELGLLKIVTSPSARAQKDAEKLRHKICQFWGNHGK